MKKLIESFQGEHRFLSNFWPCSVTCDFEGLSIQFTNTEQAYQAHKFGVCSDEFWEIVKAIGPGHAKKLADKFKQAGLVMPSFYENRLQIMAGLIDQKFDYPELRSKLLDTIECMIYEGNNWGDDFWGVDSKTLKGKNMLGQLLMLKRDKIVAEELMALYSSGEINKIFLGQTLQQAGRIHLLNKCNKLKLEAI